MYQCYNVSTVVTIIHEIVKCIIHLLKALSKVFPIIYIYILEGT